MSGYDSETGWTHFTPSKWKRYLQRGISSREEVEAIFEMAAVEFYWDASDGIHAHCDEGSLWQILSGEPAVWGERNDSQHQTEWISVTDLGANFDPPKATNTVLALLRRIGLLDRSAGKDIPSLKANGLYQERSAGESVRFMNKPGAIQRRWAYEVLGMLKSEKA